MFFLKDQFFWSVNLGRGCSVTVTVTTFLCSLSCVFAVFHISASTASSSTGAIPCVERRPRRNLRCPVSIFRPIIKRTAVYLFHTLLSHALLALASPFSPARNHRPPRRPAKLWTSTPPHPRRITIAAPQCNSTSLLPTKS